MSFTGDVKQELCKMPLQKKCCMVAQFYGLMLYANSFTIEKIKFNSDNAAVRKHFFTIMGKLFPNLAFVDDSQGSIIIDDVNIIQKIYALFGYDYKEGTIHLNRAVIDDECCKEAFLRGIFLASGYISEPEKGYHLELVTTHYSLANQVLLLLTEIDFPTKMIVRRGNYVIYYKGSDIIERFLTTIGATNCALELMLKKIEKDLRNNVNRKVNCEVSNLAKIADASLEQVVAIEKLKEKNRFDDLPKPLKEAADIRMENPELKLGELAALCNPPISKPGFSGRMRKIIKLAKEC